MGRGVVESALRARSRAPGLKLIETFGWDGKVFTQRLPLHLVRLQRSARLLGWPCDLEAVHSALKDQGVPGGAMRVRLTLDRHGKIDLSLAEMPAVTAPWRLGLAGARLASHDEWLTIKSTRRAVYDETRANLPASVDEVVFRNERDEICDGTISTLFFDRGQGMRTPPLTSGLLPGVLREAMAVPEEVLMASDLAHVRLWVGNSLRGIIPALWVDI